MDKGVILLVEDNPDDEALTLRALKSSNIANEVVVTRDGVEALDYLFGTGAYADRDTRAMPQVILLDLKLPKMDGLELAEALHRQDNTLPVIVMTGYSSVKNAVDAMKMGAFDYIAKPFEPEEVFSALQRFATRSFSEKN